jgi:hypothetical protein
MLEERDRVSSEILPRPAEADAAPGQRVMGRRPSDANPRRKSAMKFLPKAFAPFAVALATLAATTAMAEDRSATPDCSRQATGDTTAPCATPQADRAVAQYAAQTKREVTRVDRAVATDVSRPERGIARQAATARPPTNGAVLADGVTIDGGQ